MFGWMVAENGLVGDDGGGEGSAMTTAQMSKKARLSARARRARVRRERRDKAVVRRNEEDGERCNEDMDSVTCA